MRESAKDLPGIRIITVSGRIASGSTTLAKKLAKILNWRHIEGGDIFWEAVRAKLNLDSKDTNKRPDVEDEEFDASLKTMLKEKEHLVLETKLAGFNAQGVEGVFKILVICNHHGEDQPQIRIDRLINRETLTTEVAKEEVIEREVNDLEKWRRMYANNDSNWNYWKEEYYDLVINTYDHNVDESLKIALKAVGIEE
jgi:CMP/dCMP kinase